MNNEKILKDIDELIMTNRVARQFAGTEMVKDSLRKSNDVLARARTVIKNAEKDNYEKGLNDAWGLAQKICGHNDGCLRPIDVRRTFGDVSMSVILSDHTYQEALAKVKVYEETEKETKLVPGDVVEYYSITTRTTSPKSFGVFLYEDLVNNYYWVLPSYKGCPQQLPKGMFKLRKTGEHINFDYTKIGDSDE